MVARPLVVLGFLGFVFAGCSSNAQQAGLVRFRRYRPRSVGSTAEKKHGKQQLSQARRRDHPREPEPRELLRRISRSQRPNARLRASLEQRAKVNLTRRRSNPTRIAPQLGIRHYRVHKGNMDGFHTGPGK